MILSPWEAAVAFGAGAFVAIGGMAILVLVLALRHSKRGRK